MLHKKLVQKYVQNGFEGEINLVTIPCYMTYLKMYGDCGHIKSSEKSCIKKISLALFITMFPLPFFFYTSLKDDTSYADKDWPEAKKGRFRERVKFLRFQVQFAL